MGTRGLRDGAFDFAGGALLVIALYLVYLAFSRELRGTVDLLEDRVITLEDATHRGLTPEEEASE